MTDESYRTAFTVEQSPAEVSAAINDVRSWWTGEIDGVTDTLGAEFTYRYRDLHESRQAITELVPGERVVWDVTEGYLSFVGETDEWKGTQIVFELVPDGDGTELRFTHVGLTPDGECYGSCSGGWNALVQGNLRRLIVTGEPQPNPFEAKV
jgi:hypothetical protein